MPPVHVRLQGWLTLHFGRTTAGRESFQNWLTEFDHLVPNGIRRLYGNEVTIESAARVIAAFIYLATVEHEILGTGLWNYQLWTNVQPVPFTGTDAVKLWTCTSAWLMLISI